MTPELRASIDASPVVLTIAQVAKLLKVSPRSASRLFDSGRLRGYRIPGSQDRRVPRECLLRFLSEHGLPTEEVTQPPAPEPTAHEIKKQFLQFIAFAATVRPTNTRDWLEMFVTEATKSANFLGFSGRYVLRNGLVTWIDE